MTFSMNKLNALDDEETTPALAFSSTAPTLPPLAQYGDSRKPDGFGSRVLPEEDAETGCGGCGWHPSFLRSLGNRHMFAVIFCLNNVLQAMVFTYFTGVQTSVERHFHFSSQQMGLLPSIGQLGPLLTAVGMSYIAGHGNRPRWMGLGMLVVCLGALLGALGYLLFDFTEVRDNRASSRRLCDPVTSHDRQSAEHDVTGNATDAAAAAECTIDVTSSATAYLLWSFVYILIDCGSQTIYVVSAPYMDDAVATKNSPLVFALAGISRIVGPILGYMLASACINQYVNPFMDPGITRKDQRWIGAWWIGLLVIAGLLALYGWLMSLFPKRPNTTHLPVEEHQSRQKTITKKTKLSKREFVSQLQRVLRNPVLVGCVLSNAAYLTGLLGFFTYQPKYLEHQFRIHKAMSTTYSAVSKVTLLIGILGAGIVMRRFRLSGRMAAGAVVVFRVIGCLCFLGNLWVHCPDPDLPGKLTDTGLDIGASCAATCGCTTEEYIPVCLRTADGTGTGYQSYFSPCHAGCTTVSNDTTGRATYTDCSCLEDPRSTLSSGLCVESCETAFKWFLMFTALKGLFASMVSIPQFIILLRSVRPEDKAMAMGLTSTVTALAFGLGPLIMGTLVDMSCLVWEQSCGHTGACWVYHPDTLRYALVGFLVALSLLSVFFDCIVVAFSKNLKLYSEKEKQSAGTTKTDAVGEMKNRSEEVDFTAM